ncbi:DUF2063 domain-containing protein [Ahniella affigens]|uniref:DUF2063 domain-containing protein n=1 Tax=Ahniella affigens TaxID=2021234 RepID=A0A2P1PLJ7_9GAMM|nr:putative DNA-binding domain-containing protein [Ahniella affigens]AVP95705.1 DUF2063 domain-containing protein [Ahniella affigens]
MTEAFQALQVQFAQHLRDPEANPAPAGIEDRRLQIYRDLFFNSIEGLLGSQFPVIKRLKGDAWKPLVRRFYAEHCSHTPLFPEIAREFIRYLEDRHDRGESDWPFLIELAHYEWVELAVMIDETDLDTIVADQDGDVVLSAPVFSPVAWLLNYRFPVQAIREDFLPTEAPEQPTFLCVSRTRGGQVQFTELNALSFKLLELVKDNPGVPGLELIQALLEALGLDGNAELLQSAQDMLRKFRSKEILLGTMRDED